jgi:hypothetical protein
VPNEPDWLPPGVDVARANVARIYDYLLGGSHNFSADQDLARQICAVEPRVRALAHGNRAFLRRAVRALSGAGISQFLDIGSGIPTQGNVHEVAQAANPAARVVYVDTDPVVVAHSRAILGDSPATAAIAGDLRDPAAILADDTLRGVLDLSQPVGLLLIAVLHFISDADQPGEVVAALRDGLAPGSCLVISHATSEGQPAVAKAIQTVYNRSSAMSGYARSRAEILRLFDGFALLDPGLVRAPQWRPELAAEPPGNADELWHVLCGAGRRP